MLRGKRSICEDNQELLDRSKGCVQLMETPVYGIHEAEGWKD